MEERTSKLDSKQDSASVLGKGNVSPLRLLIVTVASIFIGEGFIMFLLHLYPLRSPTAEGIIDSLLLTIIVFPLVYFFMFR